MIALLLIGFGVWFLLSSNEEEEQEKVVYDEKYACDTLRQKDDSIIACELLQTEREYLILGVKKVEDRYEAFYQFNLSNGSLIELPMTDIQTG